MRPTGQRPIAKSDSLETWKLVATTEQFANARGNPCVNED